MNIVNKKPDMVPFEKISCGEVFKDEHSNYCMKTMFSGNANMVYLSNGDVGLAESDELFERVHAELVILNK